MVCLLLQDKNFSMFISLRAIKQRKYFLLLVISEFYIYIYIYICIYIYMQFIQQEKVIALVFFLRIKILNFRKKTLPFILSFLSKISLVY